MRTTLLATLPATAFAMPHSLRTVSSTGVIAENVFVFPSYDTSILNAKPVILYSLQTTTEIILLLWFEGSLAKGQRNQKGTEHLFNKLVSLVSVPF